jgi:trehalose 6-phosphate synthase/phosphatase
MASNRRIVTGAIEAQLLREFAAAHRRLVLCDYDGTLVPLQPTPEQAGPDPELRPSLERLALVSDVVIVSGRPRATLERWFGQLPIALVAEHGAWIRERGRDWAAALSVSSDWKPKVRGLMELFVERLPGAMLEEKDFTLAWHYRRADPDLACRRAQDLLVSLVSLIETIDLRIVRGSKVIEVQPAGFDKGRATQRFLAGVYDFVLALGDDATDEDLFQILPATAWSIHVGSDQSHARFSIQNPDQARALLHALTTLNSNAEQHGATEPQPNPPSTPPPLPNC